MSEWDDLNELTLMALCVWGEARGEPIECKVAYVNLIHNRATKRKQTIRQVILAPKQFSCFNPDDPNLNKMRAIRDTDELRDAAYWECYWAAYGKLYGYLQDNTKGATHCNTLACDPTWDDNMIKTAQYGKTEFFREA